MFPPDPAETIGRTWPGDELPGADGIEMLPPGPEEVKEPVAARGRAREGDVPLAGVAAGPRLLDGLEGIDGLEPECCIGPDGSEGCAVGPEGKEGW